MDSGIRGVRSLFSGSASPLALVGSALFWLWTDAAVFSDTLCAFGRADGAYQLTFVAITVGSVVGFLILPRLLRGGIFSQAHLIEALAFMVAGSLGSACIALSHLAPGVGEASALVAGSLLSAAFFSFYNVLWGLVCVAQGRAKALAHISAAWSIGLPLNLALEMLPDVVAAALVAALPMFSGLVYAVLHFKQGVPLLHVEQERFPKRDILPRNGTVAGVDVRLLMLILAFCTIFGFMYMNQIIQPSEARAFDMGPFVVGARGVTALVFFAASLTVLRDRIALLFRICFFVLVAGFAVVIFSMFVPALADISGAMIAIVYCGFDILVWVMIAFHGHVSANEPAKTIGVTMFAEQLGICVGALAGLALSLSAIDESGEAIALMVLELVAMAVLVVYTEYGSRLWTLLLKTSATMQVEEPLQRSDDDGIGDFARRYGLTEREAEVVALFVQGRSMGYIAEKVCVSENTIKTHVRHVYTKCGIHNKQELIDLVEGSRGR